MELQIIAEIFKKGRIKHLPKGQVVIYEGDPTTSIYFIQKGYVKVYNIFNGGEERIIFIYGPGDVFPLTSYLSGSGVVRYFYECMSDAQLYVLGAEELRAKIKNNFDAGEALVNYSNQIQNQFMERIDNLSINDARRKIIALFSFLIDKTGKPAAMTQLGINLTQQDIANMCAITRETASAQILKLKRQGVIA
jgi:CRP-like cAMP-binding protein